MPLRRSADASTPPTPRLQRWRLTFAQVIAADDRAMLYVPGGANVGTRTWIPLRAAVATGRAYFVRANRTVLAVDADTEDAESSTLTLFKMMIAEQLRPVLVASGGRGRFHLFCRIGNDTIRTAFALQATSLSLDVRQTIRPPLAPHRVAGCSYPIRPADWRIALAALATVPRRRRALSPTMQQLLRHGE